MKNNPVSVRKIANTNKIDPSFASVREEIEVGKLKFPFIPYNKEIPKSIMPLQKAPKRIYLIADSVPFLSKLKMVSK